MQEVVSLGHWLRRRRRALELTQEDLARRVPCAPITIRKLEADERRPSRETAERLAEALEIPPEERKAFLRASRANRHATTRSRGIRLPVWTTRLLGRDRDVETVSRLLSRADVRLLTLTGPGGVGKTRLAVHAANTLLDRFADGVYFVPLAPIGDPELVTSAIAETLGVRESSGRSLPEDLRDYLRPQHLLLLLDNCEQVTEAALQLTGLLEAAPKLKMLATSRARLRLRGEHEYQVLPLPVPRLEHSARAETLAQYDAVRLFAERAQHVEPGFALTGENAADVASICARLDGLPLAIELAAARVKVFPPQAMLPRLSSRLELLTGGPRDLPARQQTLRGAIAWSYDLLSEEEKSLFARLAVFREGSSLETIEAICNPKGDIRVLEDVCSLVEKSLLQQAKGAREPRFVMLETIHEYACERLEASGEGDELRNRHAEYYLALAEEAEPQLAGGRRQTEWLQRLEEEHDNLRAALSWSFAGADAELGMRLVAALWRFWEVHGHWTEGRRWLETALAAGEAPVPLRARLLHGAGLLAHGQGDHVRATSCYEGSLDLFRRLEDETGVVHVLHALGTLAWMQGKYERAEDLLEESLALRRRLGETRHIAVALNNLGYVAILQGQYERAGPLCHEALALFREERDDWGIALTLGNLGRIAMEQAQYEEATALLGKSQALLRRLGDRRNLGVSLVNLGLMELDRGRCERAADLLEESLRLLTELGGRGDLAYCLEGLAQVAAAQDRPERAARLAGTAEEMRRAVGSPLAPIERARYERYLEPARARSDHAAWRAACAEGRMMTLDEAIEYALN